MYRSSSGKVRPPGIHRFRSFLASESKPIDTESGWKRYLDSTSTASRIIFGLKFSGGVVSAWAILRALNYLDQVGVL